MTIRAHAIAGGIILAGMLCGLTVWGGFEATVSMTTSNEFCGSCHEMASPADDYRHSIHYVNAAGVRADCADCHVPKPFAARIAHMIGARKDVWGHITGVIDTPEKFAAHKLAMARAVWAEMTENDSLGCRSCHSFEAMDFANQKPQAAKAMHVPMPEGTSCISCHKGIAHHLPPVTAASLNETMAAMVAAAHPAIGARLTSARVRPLFLDADSVAGGDGQGNLLPGSTVAVSGMRDKLLRVEITGWQQDKAVRAIYASPGQRILTASLTPAAAEKLKTGAEQTDPDTSIVWRAVSLTAWIAADGMVTNERELWSSVADIYPVVCGSCHALTPPAAYTANQWVGTVSAMRQFVALDDNQYRLLTKYLQLSAKGVTPADAAGAQ